MASNAQNRIYGSIRLSPYRQLLVFISGTVFLMLGLAWLYAFLIVGIRPHHAPVMVSVGILAILLAIGLFLKRRTAVLVSLVVAMLVLLFSIYIQLRQFEILIPLAISGLGCLTYLAFLGPTIWDDFKNRGSDPLEN